MKKENRPPLHHHYTKILYIAVLTWILKAWYHAIKG